MTEQQAGASTAGTCEAAGCSCRADAATEAAERSDEGFATLCRRMMSGGATDCCGPQMRQLMGRSGAASAAHESTEDERETEQDAPTASCCRSEGRLQCNETWEQQTV